MPRYRVEWTITVRGSSWTDADDEGEAETNIRESKLGHLFNNAFDNEVEVTQVDIDEPDGLDGAKRMRE